ncbi:MAG TPA: hypothetical protein PK916_16580 [Bacteroidota bacterium]|nr:hypothetical protein [Bacteroidota bacterium]
MQHAAPKDITTTAPRSPIARHRLITAKKKPAHTGATSTLRPS